MILLCVSGKLRELWIPMVKECRIAAPAHDPNNLRKGECRIDRWLAGGDPPLAGILNRKSRPKDLSRITSTTRLLASDFGVFELGRRQEPDFVCCCSFKYVHVHEPQKRYLSGHKHWVRSRYFARTWVEKIPTEPQLFTIFDRAKPQKCEWV